MRDLTALEIDQFDFPGRVPELNVAGYRHAGKAAAKTSARKFSLNAQPFAKRSAKRRLQIGRAQTA